MEPKKIKNVQDAIDAFTNPFNRSDVVIDPSYNSGASSIGVGPAITENGPLHYLGDTTLAEEMKQVTNYFESTQDKKIKELEDRIAKLENLMISKKAKVIGGD